MNTFFGLVASGGRPLLKEHVSVGSTAAMGGGTVNVGVDHGQSSGELGQVSTARGADRDREKKR